MTALPRSRWAYLTRPYYTITPHYVIASHPYNTDTWHNKAAVTLRSFIRLHRMSKNYSGPASSSDEDTRQGDDGVTPFAWGLTNYAALSGTI